MLFSRVSLFATVWKSPLLHSEPQSSPLSTLDCLDLLLSHGKSFRSLPPPTAGWPDPFTAPLLPVLLESQQSDRLLSFMKTDLLSVSRRLTFASNPFLGFDAYILCKAAIWLQSVGSVRAFPRRPLQEGEHEYRSSTKEQLHIRQFHCRLKDLSSWRKISTKILSKRVPEF